MQRSTIPIFAVAAFALGCTHPSHCVEQRVWDADPVNVDGNASDQLHVAFDAAGNAIAIWEEYGGTAGITLWSATRAPSGAWSTPVRINPMGTSAAVVLAAQLAVSANGTAVAVWEQRSPANLLDVWANNYAPGTGWAGDRIIQAPAVTTSNARSAQVAIDSSGNAMAVFEEDVGADSSRPDSGFQIYANRFTPGGGWASAVRLSTADVPTGDGPSQDARVAVDDAGDAFAVWAVDRSNVGEKVQGTLYDPSTNSWATPVDLDACTGCANTTAVPHVVAHQNRDALATWTQDPNGQGQRVWSARYSHATSSWSSPPDLVDPATPATDTDIDIDLATDRNGNAVAIWTVPAAGVFASYFTAGAWTSVVNIGPPTSGGYPSVAFDPTGDAIAAWDDGELRSAELSAASRSWSADTVVVPAGLGATGASVAVAQSGCTRALVAFSGAQMGAFVLAQH
jgi:hypothetical protein